MTFVCPADDVKAITACDLLASEIAAAGLVCDRFDAADFGPRDLLAAEILVLASEIESSMESRYKELKRVCEGINLAGRRVGLVGNPGTRAWFARVLAPTDASVVAQDDVAGKNAAEAFARALLGP